MATHRTIDLDLIAERLVRWSGRMQAPDAPPGARVDPVGQKAPGTYAAFSVPLALFVSRRLEDLPERQRRTWAHTVAALQKADGTYTQRGRVKHSDWHAMCMGCMATRALGARPRHPYSKLQSLLEPRRLRLWLGRRDWHDQWLGSREVWGACMLVLGAKQTPPEWREALGQWLDDEQDPSTGLWRKHIRAADRYQTLAGAFHILSLYHKLGRPVPQHHRIIDSVLSMQKLRGAPKGLFSGLDRPHLGELHAAVVLDWMTRVEAYRVRDVIRALARLGRNVEQYFRSSETLPFEHDDAHGVLVRMRLLAALQRSIPEFFQSSKTWYELWSVPGLYVCRY